MEQNEKTNFIRTLLNNNILLKWVKKYSADNLFNDNELAKKFKVNATDNSISIGDKGVTKLIVTSASYSGKEVVRYSIKAIKETLELLGAEGELIVSAEEGNALIGQVKDTLILISSLPKVDEK